jgi:uncharacterized protein (DUF2267 family)
VSDTPPGNPLSRGDKRAPSRPGSSSAAFVTHLVEDGRLEPSLAECAAVSVLTGLMRHLVLDESQEPEGHLLSKLAEFLPARDASKDLAIPSEGSEPLLIRVGQDLSLEPERVELLVRALFQALRMFLSEGECHDVERGLSWELQYLWRRTQ